jgi:hypothetical protein
MEIRQAILREALFGVQFAYRVPENILSDF